MTTVRPRWYRLTPDRLIVGLLAVEGLLLLSEWFDWFAFNGQTWTVLIALAAVGATLFLMLLWFVTALLFRRRFQYGLRSLMLFAVAVAVPCSWVAVEIQNERKQKVAADEIRRLGGDVEFEQTWLGKILRDESLVLVTRVGLTGTPTTDAGLVYLQGLRQLQWLSLANSKVSDGGLVHLEGLSQLRVLYLDNTKISDSGLMHLEGLSQLQWLDLNNTGVGDSGLVYLEGSSQLQGLWLDNTTISDSGLVHLQGLKQLGFLFLDDTKVSDEGVKRLQQALPNCQIAH